MVPVGSEQERARLERVYSEMSEGELRSIATDAASLTSEAFQALRAVISGRGLDIAVSASPSSRNAVSQTEFTTRHGLVMLGTITIFAVTVLWLVVKFVPPHCVPGLRQHTPLVEH